MKAVLAALAGGIVSVLAFPPYGPGWLVVLGVALFLWALRLASDRRQGLLIGAVYGLVFFSGLIWWLAELELIALLLVPVQAAFFALYGWWVSRYNDHSPAVWLAAAVGGWAFMEIFRYRFPVGGFEWGAAGYALSDNIFTRIPAAVIGTTGLTILIVLIGAVLAQMVTQKADRSTAIGTGVAVLVLGGSFLWMLMTPTDDAEPVEQVAIVQGSTPCPFEHCSPNERLRTFEQHLELTKTIPDDSVDLVIWSEGSTGSTNADPVLNPEVGAAIAEQARRLNAWFLVGGDRPVSDTEWINANVVFNPDGEIVGEYRKQHPVPFGEYIPLRPLFDWIPALDRVPRDQIPGDGPVVFDTGNYTLGSVISFEGGFSRYSLEHRRSGADIMVVATNEASYGLAPTSDQFIGMTRMRAVELGVPVIHAAVTGKSTFADPNGDIFETTGLGTQEIALRALGADRETPYTFLGDLVLYLSAVVSVLIWWRARAV
ncbi:MAG: apolipoprotein N-acyltransferase [Actinomycetota bacterium]|nr:apolipoprotein N-acyltransferase [Actinomycetota bacterium]